MEFCQSEKVGTLILLECILVHLILTFKVYSHLSEIECETYRLFRCVLNNFQFGIHMKSCQESKTCGFPVNSPYTSYSSHGDRCHATQNTGKLWEFQTNVICYF